MTSGALPTCSDADGYYDDMTFQEALEANKLNDDDVMDEDLNAEN
jgi:hypothetical protein